MVKFCVKISVQKLRLRKVQDKHMRKTLTTVILSVNEESRLSSQNTGFFANDQNDENNACNMQFYKKGI